MPNFTTETLVRLRFQVNDATLVPADLVNQAIDDAHTELLQALDPIYDTGSPSAAQVLGETLLAGAHLLRALASGEAFRQKNLAVGGRRIQDSDRFASLMAYAAETERQAWTILAPFIAARPAREIAQTTDTTPVLGEE